MMCRTVRRVQGSLIDSSCRHYLCSLPPSSFTKTRSIHHTVPGSLHEKKSTSTYRAKRPNDDEIPESVRRLSSSSRPDNPPQAHHEHNQPKHKRPETVRDVSHMFLLQRRNVPSYRLLQTQKTSTLHHTTLTTDPPKCTPLL